MSSHTSRLWKPSVKSALGEGVLSFLIPRSFRRFVYHNYASELNIARDPDWAVEEESTSANNAASLTDEGGVMATDSADSEEVQINQEMQHGVLLDGQTTIGDFPGANGHHPDTLQQQEPTVANLRGRLSLCDQPPLPQAPSPAQPDHPQQDPPASGPRPGQPLGEGTEDSLMIQSREDTSGHRTSVNSSTGGLSELLVSPTLHVLRPGSLWATVQQAVREGQVAALKASKQYSVVSQQYCCEMWKYRGPFFGLPFE